MSTAEDGQRCPTCGAENQSGAERCFLCHQALLSSPSGSVDAASPWVAPTASPTLAPVSIQADMQRTLSISSLMLIIALIAVCLGLLVEAPGLGILFAMISVPALIRTMRGQAQAGAEPMTASAKITLFLVSSIIVAIILMSTLVAFTIICFPTGLLTAGWLEGFGVLLAFVAGTIAAGFVGFQVSRALWPYRRSR